ncbi:MULTISPECIES: YmfQ family protein [Clostridium]|uniref:YmfQ family protein n=1 Tax=Clostridium TaxID=1485 RepID=UPI000DEB73BD|nr:MULTISPECIES: YmfQ family protein [Clostridium]AXB84603.1 phage portal protein [Clostridium butyricum]MDU4587052.1 YmfQ family protein [Clostridium sp.]
MYYGQSKYGVSKYAENIPTQDEVLKNYPVDLSKYVPQDIYNGNVFNKIYKSQEYQLGVLYWQMDDLLKQCFIDTATWGLIYWEEEYGIGTNLNYSYEERREVVKAKKRGQGTCTKSLIKSVAEAFSGGECNVIENTAPYTFTIQFVGIKGIPKNMQGLINAVDEIKPAHLVYNFKYTYTSWDYLDGKNLSYNNAEKILWTDLEIYD